MLLFKLVYLNYTVNWFFGGVSWHLTFQQRFSARGSVALISEDVHLV